MSLPYSYKTIYETDITPEKFFLKLKKNSDVRNLSIDDKYAEFGISSFFGGINTKVLLEFKRDNSGFTYEFFVDWLLKASIVLIIALAFLTSGFKDLLLYSSIIIISLYLIFVFHLKYLLENIFDQIIESKILPEEISSEQQKWIDNPDICPACGAELTEFDQFCPECKLNLTKRRSAKKQPVSRTGYFGYRINYQYNKSKTNE